MNAHARSFEIKEATRQQVPCLVGLSGPSGSGKTYSALRLATGMQQVTGGDIVVVDTESKRALHYADRFKFKHVEFGAPFGSLDYLAVLQHVVQKGVKNVVIDSASHEHEGLGGYLETHAAELQRLGGEAKNNFTAWIKPAAERRKLINGLLQLNANFIFCFRAKDKIKVAAGGKPQPLGFMPIAGEEFVYEMTLCALLYPGAGGVPTWTSTAHGERTMLKLPEQFRDMFAANGPLDEEAGKLLAQWAAGGATPQTGVATIIAEAKRAATGGTAAFLDWWKLPTTKPHWAKLKPHTDEFKAIAAKADEAPANPEDADPFGLPQVPIIDAKQDENALIDTGTSAERAAAVAERDKLLATALEMPDIEQLNAYVGSIDPQLQGLPDDLLKSFDDAIDDKRKKFAVKVRK